MQDLTVTLEKIAKMQDEIIPPFCRFDSAKVLTDTVSISTRENVTVILSATLPKSELHFAFLIFKGAFCAFEPLQQRGVQNAPHVKRVQRQIDARSCVAGITPSHSTVIHHKRASRYVVLGEILLSPFTTYIFT